MTLTPTTKTTTTTSDVVIDARDTRTLVHDEIATIDRSTSYTGVAVGVFCFALVGAFCACVRVSLCSDAIVMHFSCLCGLFVQGVVCAIALANSLSRK